MKKMVLPALFTLFFVVSAFSQGGVPEPPKLISTPKVDYPTVAKDSDIYGAVFVRVSVDEAGNVTSAEFARGPGSVCGSVTFEPVVALRNAAVDAARQAKFEPARSGDHAVPYTTEMRFTFAAPPGRSSKKAETTFSAVGTSDESTATNESQTISGGVMNGKALALPKPSYPAAARAVRASGAVPVQVLIYEDGTVFSAEAVGGHPLLQAASVAAACSAKFTPVLLSGQPVKVSGIITYNFVP
jgi:TonB family protein